MSYVKTFIVLAVVSIAAVSAFIWSGAYNIAANAPHWGITFQLLELVRERSIAAHSRNISVPSLSDQNLLKQGVQEFHETCRLCHGAPGISREPFAMGLYPSPPNLASPHLFEELGEAGVFWVAKNGLKMTGMPSFGATDDDREIWSVIAFLKRLPNMKSGDYNTLIENAGAGAKEGETKGS